MLQQMSPLVYELFSLNAYLIRPFLWPGISHFHIINQVISTPSQFPYKYSKGAILASFSQHIFHSASHVPSSNMPCYRSNRKKSIGECMQCCFLSTNRYSEFVPYVVSAVIKIVLQSSCVFPSLVPESAISPRSTCSFSSFQE